MAEKSQRTAQPGAQRRPWWRWSRRVALTVVILAAAGVLWPNIAAWWAARGRMFDHVDAVPAGRVGLVFGCDDRVQGRENLYFRHRIDAAAELWHAGKLRCIIVSGDNETIQYNEPQRMKNALVAKGVPADRIVPDCAGFRTLDSVVRAKKVFLLSEVTFITQRFQNERALYLARSAGLDAVAFNAEDLNIRSGAKTKLRELGARVVMWFDVNLLNTQPRHLGDPVPLPP